MNAGKAANRSENCQSSKAFGFSSRADAEEAGSIRMFRIVQSLLFLSQRVRQSAGQTICDSVPMSNSLLGTLKPPSLAGCQQHMQTLQVEG